eukprot:TRINITY_DN45022_c0_g1_i1.p1 TRINITY_DN45022_c0_g1~~TRINITY_DN45022_c0_g1_i1.p1  ORF type:complete len:359 (+),score=64.08 TRINITY_DN45022_c0_g1_i1:86-1162(+)
MSFRDLNGVNGRISSRQQPRPKKDDETNFEPSIKDNIQEIQDLNRRANEFLEQAQRSFLSKRIGDSLDRVLEQSQQLSQETDRLFRDWTVHLAGEPSERQRKKFSFEKLRKTFEEEVVSIKEVARRVVVLQQEATLLDRGSGPIECRPVCEEQTSFSTFEDVEHGLLDDSTGQVSRMAQQEDATIRNRIAQEREEGIRRIQSQVHEVNQIFRDLASIVQEQGHEIESIERTAESSCADTKQAASELRKAADRQRGSRERLCCMLTAAVILLFLVVLPHMHMSQLSPFSRSKTGTRSSAAEAPVTASAAPPGWRAAVIPPSSKSAGEVTQTAGLPKPDGTASSGNPPSGRTASSQDHVT